MHAVLMVQVMIQSQDAATKNTSHVQNQGQLSIIAKLRTRICPGII
jgi:hypothetical protein